MQFQITIKLYFKDTTFTSKKWQKNAFHQKAEGERGNGVNQPLLFKI